MKCARNVSLPAAAAAAVLALLLWTRPAGALHIQHSHHIGAEAFWSMGGILEPPQFISVLAEDFTDPLPGPRNSFSRIEVRTQEFIEGDPSTNADDKIRQILGSAVLDPAELVVDDKLREASVNATLQGVFLCETSALPPPPGTLPPSICSRTTLSVNIAWTAVGDVERESQSSHFGSSACQSTEMSVGKFRLAVATGTISLPGGPNLIPGPSSPAQIFEVRSGSVTGVGCFLGP